HQARPGGGDGVEHGVDLEPGQDDRRRPGEQSAVQPDAQAVDVEERQGQQQAVGRRPAPCALDRRRRGQEVAVAQRNALRGAGRARREHQQGRVVRPAASRSGAGPSGRSTSAPGEGTSGSRPGSSRIASAGLAAAATVPISVAPKAVLTGTTTNPRRRGATWATARSTDAAAPTSSRSPRRSPAAAYRAATAAVRSSSSVALTQRPSGPTRVGAPGASAHRAAQARGRGPAGARWAAGPAK